MHLELVFSKVLSMSTSNLDVPVHVSAFLPFSPSPVEVSKLSHHALAEARTVIVVAVAAWKAACHESVQRRNRTDCNLIVNIDINDKRRCGSQGCKEC